VKSLLLDSVELFLSVGTIHARFSGWVLERECITQKPLNHRLDGKMRVISAKTTKSLTKIKIKREKEIETR
jgi:hypothetical protein